MHAAATKGDVNIEAAAHLFSGKHVQLTLGPASLERWYHVKNGHHPNFATAVGALIDCRPIQDDRQTGKFTFAIQKCRRVEQQSLAGSRPDIRPRWSRLQ